MSGPSIEELARATDPMLRQFVGAARRMAIKLTSRVLWQLVGHRIDGVTETLPAEPFSGIGFYSRPPASGKPEAIVIFVGGAKSPAVVAMRDEKTRAASVSGLAEDETAIYTSHSVVHLRANGAVEVRGVNGTAVPLATKADLEALRSAFATWVPAPNDGGGALKTELTELFGGGWPTGTTVLRGQ